MKISVCACALRVCHCYGCFLSNWDKSMIVDGNRKHISACGCLMSDKS